MALKKKTYNPVHRHLAAASVKAISLPQEMPPTAVFSAFPDCIKRQLLMKETAGDAI